MVEQRGVRDGKRLHGVITGAALGKLIGVSISVSAMVTHGMARSLPKESRCHTAKIQLHILQTLTNILV